MTVAIPSPGRRRAHSRSSSSGSPKCMKRPPLHVPMAVVDSSDKGFPPTVSHDMPDDTRVTRTRRGLGRATTVAVVVVLACASPALASLRYHVATDYSSDQW